MAHQSGILECVQCRHFHGEAEGDALPGAAGWCAFHETELKACSDHRFCVQLVPGVRYDQDHPRRLVNGRFVQTTVTEQLNGFGIAWEPGCLYRYDPSQDQSPQPWVVPAESPAVSAPRDDQRHRIEAALLADDTEAHLDQVVAQLLREGAGGEQLRELLVEYVQMLSGNRQQVRALERVVLRLKQEAEPS
ncbi:MAG: hypothetical protein R3236_06455 [Phycisphaeraceae bacterium]|nr:hypothetical protein [Phycisphaeraceae bacterium]